jgi:hypothetical protein
MTWLFTAFLFQGVFHHCKQCLYTRTLFRCQDVLQGFHEERKDLNISH